MGSCITRKLRLILTAGTPEESGTANWVVATGRGSESVLRRGERTVTPGPGAGANGGEAVARVERGEENTENDPMLDGVRPPYSSRGGVSAREGAREMERDDSRSARSSAETPRKRRLRSRSRSLCPPALEPDAATQCQRALILENRLGWTYKLGLPCVSGWGDGGSSARGKESSRLTFARSESVLSPKRREQKPLCFVPQARPEKRSRACATVL